LLELFSASSTLSFAEDVLSGVGTFAGMGGGTLLDACLVVEEFFGAVADIEGRVALLELFSASLPPSSFVEVALSGVGAFADMGGKALPDAGFVVEEFFGALADIEGRVALLELFSASLLAILTTLLFRKSCTERCTPGRRFGCGRILWRRGRDVLQ